MQVELEQLLILQDRAQKIRQVDAELKSLPLERKSLDAQVAVASANLVATKDRARHVEMEKKKLELDVGTREESIARLKTQQYETRKNDEFSAMGREIERYQNEISALEDQELELMEQADVLKAQIATEEKQTATAKESIAKQIADLGAKEATLGIRLEELKKEREELAAKVDEDLLDRFNRLFASKGDAAVVALEHDVCTGCHMKITTQTAVRVKGGQEIVSCEQCGRILYFAE
ncbi:MAG TPA: C4-type zinc ribbon domain-containing protein [Chthoniobacterales bacterium]|nr:C4-type zinc ribbon domain-containing protein [Chthoniobacterales bacterium]